MTRTKVEAMALRGGRILGSGLLILAVAYSGNLLARSVWLMLEPDPVVSARVNWTLEPPAQSGERRSVQERAEQIAQSHWFGEVVPEQLAVQSNVQPVSMPETRLQLELKGVMAGSRPTSGSAMIAPRGGSSDLFRVGETVHQQAELMEVYGDRVVIRRNGELETLSFEPASDSAGGSVADRGNHSTNTASQAQAGADTATRRNVAPASQPRQQQRTAAAPPSSRNNIGENSAQRRLEEDLRQAITEVQSRAASDPSGLLRQYGLEATENGYRVTPRAGILIANGMRPGDRITEINDQPVGNIDRDQALVSSVLSSDQIKITLERSGATYRFYQSLPGS